MFGEIRQDFEVVKEGRILHLVLGCKSFGDNNRRIHGVAGSISSLPNKIRHLQSKIAGVFFFTPGLRQVLN
jgi:hypothetical protein